jgi:putative PIN family toxin of toxin-antitoxin system
MLKIVLDTNVIISAALSPTGNCEKIINTIDDNEEIQLFYSADILAEYEKVLSRKHLRINLIKQTAYIEAIKNAGIEIEPAVSDISLPDETDRIFYDAAHDVGAILITGNKRHYPDEDFIMSPAEFLQMFERE